MFPQDFIARMKMEFPREKGLHEALKTGDFPVVGRFLSDRSLLRVDPKRLIRVLTTGKSKKLLAEARAAIRAGCLYEEFNRLKK